MGNFGISQAAHFFISKYFQNNEIHHSNYASNAAAPPTISDNSFVIAS